MTWKKTALLMAAWTLFLAALITVTGLVKIDTYWQDGSLVRLGIGNMHLVDTSIIREGPHVFWDGPSALVHSRCDGRDHRRRLSSAPGTVFRDPCHGSRTFTLADAYSPDPAIVNEVPRFFAASDVEGQFERFRALLRNASVIDADGQWSFGNGHLVIVGDSVDRGDEVTGVLWLIHELERQARGAGGAVHHLLGNHEAMVLGGDEEYTHVKYRLVAPRFGVSPQGLFSRDTQLGRWLRTRNTILRLGRFLFVHGGVSVALARSGMSIEAINAGVRSAIDSQWRIADDPGLTLLFGPEGPLWYRRLVNDPQLSSTDLSSSLAAFGADTVIVGHTKVPAVTTLHGGRVVAIDTTFTVDRPQGVMWDGRTLAAFPQ